MTCHIILAMEPIEELRYLVLGAQREGNRVLNDMLRPVGITASQAEVLAVLRAAGGALTGREIGERLVCETGSRSRLVSSMVDAGLLERGARAGDRRAVQLSLTAKGDGAADRVAEAERGLYEFLASTLSEREIAALVRGLRKLVEGRAAGAAVALRRD